MSDDPYTVTITMSAGTVTALSKSGNVLFGLRAVETSDRAAVPVVWMARSEYALTTRVGYGTELRAYTSTSPIVDGKAVEMGFDVAIAKGQLLTVTDKGGAGKVTRDDMPRVVAVLNKTSDPYTCGVAELSSVPTPVCAIPLHGNGNLLMNPVPKLFLQFATTEVGTSTAMSTSGGPGVLIDQSAAPRVELTFDIDTAWTGNVQPEVEQIAPWTPLAPLLSRCSPVLADLAARRFR